jgi:rhomboid protease GluP
MGPLLREQIRRIASLASLSSIGLQSHLRRIKGQLDLGTRGAPNLATGKTFSPWEKFSMEPWDDDRMGFRRSSGSALCYACGKINRVDAPVCFYCGRRNPGLWGFGPVLGRLAGRLDFAHAVMAVCIAAYLAALLLDLPGALRPRGVLGLLSPSPAALDVLGMTGAYAWARGRWWTLVTAIYLHGGLLHILFNLLWVRQLAPAVEELFGRARLVVIFTAGGILGFAVSNLAGIAFSVGASGGIFGLLGALVFFGRSRGGTFGLAIMRQYGHWALLLFVLGFLMPGVDNLAHAGGFAGGFLAAAALGYRDRRPERTLDALIAGAAIALTLGCFALALWTGLAS